MVIQPTPHGYVGMHQPVDMEGLSTLYIDTGWEQSRFQSPHQCVSMLERSGPIRTGSEWDVDPVYSLMSGRPSACVDHKLSLKRVGGAQQWG